MEGLCLSAGACDWDHLGAQSWGMVLLQAVGTAWCVLFPLAPGPLSPAGQTHLVSMLLLCLFREPVASPRSVGIGAKSLVTPRPDSPSSSSSPRVIWSSAVKLARQHSVKSVLALCLMLEDRCYLIHRSDWSGAGE